MRTHTGEYHSSVLPVREAFLISQVLIGIKKCNLVPTSVNGVLMCFKDGAPRGAKFIAKCGFKGFDIIIHIVTQTIRQPTLNFNSN